MELMEYEREHLARLRAILPDCAVLLKKNGDFPLGEPGKLALYGSGARHTVKGGTGSGEVNSRFFVTAEQGLEKAGFTVTTKAWLDGYDRVLTLARRDFVDKIKARAREKDIPAALEAMGAVMPEPEYELPLEGAGDTAVYVLSRISGEGHDRQDVPGDIFLSASERRDILALRAKYKRFMLVLNVGGPVDLSPVAEVENILLLSQLGVETGSALADMLLGRACPSGRLATTWAGAGTRPAAGDFGEADATRYREGVYVGYRWYDSAGITPMFPFGYGLGFTEFALSFRGLSAEGSRVTVTAEAENLGLLSGKETAQLYVSVPEGRLDQPFQTLAAFRKTEELAPGQRGTVEMSFDMRDLASYDTERALWVLEAGDYILRLGKNSADTAPVGVVRLPEEAVTARVKNALGTPDFTDWRPERRRNETLPAGLPAVEIDPAAIGTETFDYDREDPVDPLADSFTDEELAYIGIGAFNAGGGGAVAGNAGVTVPGAAGETSGIRRDAAPVLVMADGPAGLRLTPEYAVDEQGIVPLGEDGLASVEEFLPESERPPRRRTPGPDAVRHTQYATAIPIGTALAQSWDPAVAELCGDIVGAEMERFGVHLWLAPALNLHRDIRCGRNFEYFSEDPRISGLMAAAITRGVQAHPGCGVTIKHFAANNQETNRFSSNSVVSERAMRELYLKGFGICIREAQPAAIMTSYNLLNGVHTSERRDLIRDVARTEFGFRGIVMTDWVIGEMESRESIWPRPTASGVAAADGDLFMPGCEADYGDLLEGLRNGRVSRKQLRQNATRVIRMARRLAGKTEGGPSEAKGKDRERDR